MRVYITAGKTENLGSPAYSSIYTEDKYSLPQFWKGYINHKRVCMKECCPLPSSLTAAQPTFGELQISRRVSGLSLILFSFVGLPLNNTKESRTFRKSQERDIFSTLPDSATSAISHLQTLPEPPKKSMVQEGPHRSLLQEKSKCQAKACSESPTIKESNRKPAGWTCWSPQMAFSGKDHWLSSCVYRKGSTIL